MELKKAFKIISKEKNDAIEHRQYEFAEAMKIAEHLISEKIKAQENKPPKRLPCACGTKRIRTWTNIATNKWFLCCPNCGLQSAEVEHKNQLNKAWNDVVIKHHNDNDCTTTSNWSIDKEI